MVWTSLGAGTGVRQEGIDPRAAWRLAVGTGCREQGREVGWEGFRDLGQYTEGNAHIGRD